MVIIGDFNECLLPGGNKLANILNSNRLTHIINKSTWVIPTSATLHDVVKLISPDSITSHDVVPQIITDHDLIMATVKMNNPKCIPDKIKFCHLANFCRNLLCFL